MNLGFIGVNYFYITTKQNLQNEPVLTFITNQAIKSMQEWLYNPINYLLAYLILTIIMTYLWINTPLLGSRIYPERIQRNYR